LRILFVENHARFGRIVTQQFLSTHEVEIVSSLTAARQALKNNLFDVVLLDYDLEDGKGDTLARELSARTQRPRIVAVSSHQAGNNAILSAGADAVCNKMQFARIAHILDVI
jgi:DNA-binding response OmpR family regulator